MLNKTFKPGMAEGRTCRTGNHPDQDLSQKEYKRRDTMYLLFSVICQLFVCICYSLALYSLAVIILDRKPEKRCYLIFCITFTVLQVFTNLIYASVWEEAAKFTEISSFV